MRLTLDDFSFTEHRRYADYIALRCPFHDDAHASMLIYDSGWYRCLACEAHGPIEQVYNALRGHKAPRIASAQKTQWNPPQLSNNPELMARTIEKAHNAILGNPSLAWYLKMRGVDGMIEGARLGWLDGWYTVPIYDKDDKMQGAVMRAGPHIERASGLRFAVPKYQKPMLYCPEWRLMERAKALAVVYGIFDALALADLRFFVVTPSSGKGNMDHEWLRFWRGPIVILPDLDEEEEAINLATKLDWRGRVCKLPYPDGCKDPADFLVANRKDLEITLFGVMS